MAEKSMIYDGKRAIFTDALFLLPKKHYCVVLKNHNTHKSDVTPQNIQ